MTVPPTGGCEDWAPLGFTVLDRRAWAAIGRGRAPTGASPPAGSPVDLDEWRDVYIPLAHVIGLHIDARADLAARLHAAGAPGPAGPFVVGVAGSVSAGKSTFAEALAALLSARPGRPTVSVVSTDGFLLPNAALGARAGFKGFPDTYDAGLFADVLRRLAAGAPEVTIPRYSHEVYDIAGPPFVMPAPDIVVLEGVNTLAPGSAAFPIEPADFCSFRVFVDVDEAHLRSWYVDRFLGLIEAARQQPGSFFSQWTGLDQAAAADLAVAVWEGVNLVNLDEHILPSRWRADVVLHKDGGHAVRKVAVRNR